MNENIYNFITGLRDLCDKYLQNEATATELFPEPETVETTFPEPEPNPVAKWKATLHYSRKHRKNGRSGVARSDFRTAMIRQNVPLTMDDLKALMEELNIDQWSEGHEVRFSERYIPTLISAIKERF